MYLYISLIVEPRTFIQRALGSLVVIACLLLAACSPPQDVQSTEISVEADISAANVEPQRYLGEQPQHTVESDAYWMMQTEVTNA